MRWCGSSSLEHVLTAPMLPPLACVCAHDDDDDEADELTLVLGERVSTMSTTTAPSSSHAPDEDDEDGGGAACIDMAVWTRAAVAADGEDEALEFGARSPWSAVPAAIIAATDPVVLCAVSIGDRGRGGERERGAGEEERAGSGTGRRSAED